MQGNNSRLSAQTQQSFGLPPTLKFDSPFPFGGLNQQASRIALADNEAYWCENLIKLGDGNVRAIGDRDAPLYTVPDDDPRTIISFFAYNIATTDYFIVFFDDGSAIQVEDDNGSVTVIAGAATFYVQGGQLPACVQWGSIYLLIANNNTDNDYWAWNGTVLFAAGGLGPQTTLTSSGSNYVVAPTVTVSGGHGSGAVVEATIQNGSVIALEVVNPGAGYIPGDQVQAYFSGGGSDSSAILEAALFPVGLAAVILLAGGSGYTSDPTVTISGGGGSGATAVAHVSGGAVVSLEMTAAGNGYESAPAISFSGGGGSGAQAQATLVASGVEAVNIIDRGSNFVGIPTLTFRGGFGSGAAATPVLSGPGPIASITVTAGGTGYTSIPTVNITDNGTGATATANIVGDVVDTITVDTGGSGYTAPPIVIIDGDGRGAFAEAVLTADAVTSINVTAGGEGYTTATVRIQGGTGGGATAAVTGIANGVISEITITNDGGTNYTDPQIEITGGGGSGATATAAIGAGEIVRVVVDRPGAGYTTAPAVFVQGGLNSAAAATLSLMPFGISGTSLETYQSQVWVQNPFQVGAQPTGGVRNSTAAGSITDFATSSGGLSETVTDRFLRAQLTGIRQSNGFLYPFGDSSVGVISNVQTQGDPPTKTLNNQNTDPQTGTDWRDTLQDFSRTILFANRFGVWGLFGGAVTKVSSKIERLFNTALFPTGHDPRAEGQPQWPCAAVANIHNQKCYLLLMTVLDPFLRTYRKVLATWVDRGARDQEWTLISQSSDLTYIGTQEINDSNLHAWGTDGRSLFRLCATPSRSITKIWASKLWGAQQPYVIKLARVNYVQAINYASDTTAPVLPLTINTEYADFPAPTPQIAYPANDITLPPSAAVPPVQSPVLVSYPNADITAVYLGFTIVTTEPDFALINAMQGHEDSGAIFV